MSTYLDFLVNAVLVFGSDRTSSSSKSIEMTSSKTTPRAWDLDGALTGFIWAAKHNYENTLAGALLSVIQSIQEVECTTKAACKRILSC